FMGDHRLIPLLRGPARAGGHARIRPERIVGIAHIGLGHVVLVGDDHDHQQRVEPRKSVVAGAGIVVGRRERTEHGARDHLVVAAADAEIGDTLEFGGQIDLGLIHVALAAGERRAHAHARFDAAGRRDEIAEVGAAVAVLPVVAGRDDADVIALGVSEVGLDAGDEALEAGDQALLLIGHAAGVVDYEQDVDVGALVGGIALVVRARAALVGGHVEQRIGVVALVAAGLGLARVDRVAGGQR